MARARRSNSGSPNDPKPSFMHSSPEPSDPTLSKKCSAMKSFVRLNLHSMPISADVHNAPRAPLARDLQLESPRCPVRPRPPDMSVHSAVGVTTGLSSLLECSESSPPRRDSDSDYQPDVTEENLETAVNSLPKIEQCDLTSTSTSPSHLPDLELERLESALYGQLSVSPKRLRIKTLTLTPKHSTQRAFLVHSGDACTTELQDKKSSPQRDLRSMSALSSPRLDWTAAIPFQIATVGYAFTRNPNMLLPRRTPNSDPVVTTTTERFEAVEAVVAVEASVQVAGTDFSKRVPETQKKVCDVLVGEVNCSTTRALDVSTDLMSQEPAEHTTSLDTLVALLNEIQKITCRNHVAQPTCNARESRETYVVKPLTTRESKETSLVKPLVKPLQIADHPPSRAPPRELVAIKSLTRMRHPRSDPSIYSFCLFDERKMTANSAKPEVSNFMLAIDVRNGESTQMANNVLDVTLLADKPSTSVDKEVSANTCEIKYVDTFTDVPSKLRFWDDTPDTSTTSVSEMASEPFILSLASYDPLFCSTPLFRTYSIERIMSQFETGSTVELSQSETKQVIELPTMSQKMSQVKAKHVIALPLFDTERLIEVPQPEIDNIIEMSQVEAKHKIESPRSEIKSIIELPQIQTNRGNEMQQIKPKSLFERKQIVKEQQIGMTATLKNQYPQEEIESMIELQQTEAKYIMKMPQIKSEHAIEKERNDTKCIIEVPQIKTKHAIESSQIQTNESLIKFPHRDIDLKKQCFKPGLATVQNIVDVKKDTSRKARSDRGSKIMRKYCVKNIDLDPMLKIKRDVLVTVYSILVLTVFAALSFPNLIVSRIV